MVQNGNWSRVQHDSPRASIIPLNDLYEYQNWASNFARPACRHERRANNYSPALHAVRSRPRFEEFQSHLRVAFTAVA
ncbi:hypothetical protein E2P81_ATG06881 [Venturia nashicola]|uniref:Uncharacterized protein n=1 Tax=Venturia nashicola TaxID=86259 RepID=A0A4Z1NV13_9PEZI|nr:hypothetical protein E6O75_ATG07052 [Venturia nashicola]TLD30228.1 hypothetical protein E2P81_ATG06881 [Venturia nashicola]